jgi:hypothetical protein
MQYLRHVSYDPFEDGPTSLAIVWQLAREL